MTESQRASGSMRSQRTIQRAIDQVRTRADAIERELGTRATEAQLTTLERALTERLETLEARLDALEN